MRATVARVHGVGCGIVSRRLVPVLLVWCLPLVLPACKGGRRKLEQLVPDGATGMVSIDAKGLMQSEAYTKLKAGLGGLPKSDEASKVLTQLRDECELDPEQTEAIVMGFDLISKNVMGAMRMPNLGKLEALRCVEEVTKKNGGDLEWELAETDGKATLSFEGGEAQGWALDDDTLVFSTKGWASAVEARMKGESKGAVDNGLAEAVAMADHGKHIWFAGEIPAIIKPFLEGTPAKGIERGAGSLHYGDQLELELAVAFADEEAAKAVDDEIRPMLEDAKKLAVVGGLPQESADSLELVLDGAIMRGKVSVPMEPLLENTTGAFVKYVDRSKTSEARVQLAKMVDAASAYFNEEKISPGVLDTTAAHLCPNDGRLEGEAGMTPPLSVKCGDGPSGRCVPGSSGPGGYDIRLWTDNPVWNGLNLQVEQGHYFHYNFRWKNDPSGFGSCQFTAQAFGDLDGDGVYSTYERAGAADQLGVNMAAGLYIDQEVE